MRIQFGRGREKLARALSVPIADLIEEVNGTEK